MQCFLTNFNCCFSNRLFDKYLHFFPHVANFRILMLQWSMAVQQMLYGLASDKICFIKNVFDFVQKHFTTNLHDE